MSTTNASPNDRGARRPSDRCHVPSTYQDGERVHVDYITVWPEALHSLHTEATRQIGCTPHATLCLHFVQMIESISTIVALIVLALELPLYTPFVCAHYLQLLTIAARSVSA